MTIEVALVNLCVARFPNGFDNFMTTGLARTKASRVMVSNKSRPRPTFVPKAIAVLHVKTFSSERI